MPNQTNFWPYRWLSLMRWQYDEHRSAEAEPVGTGKDGSGFTWWTFWPNNQEVLDVVHKL